MSSSPSGNDVPQNAAGTSANPATIEPVEVLMQRIEELKVGRLVDAQARMGQLSHISHRCGVHVMNCITMVHKKNALMELSEEEREFSSKEIDDYNTCTIKAGSASKFFFFPSQFPLIKPLNVGGRGG